MRDGNAYRILVRKREVKISLRRSRSIWKDNIKTDLKEMRCGDVDLIFWLRIRSMSLLNMVINFQIQ
jgi:hypothetical protein